jgi:cardiolipin synthase A/B
LTVGVGWVGEAGIVDHFENGEFHDLFVRVEGPVVAQLQLVFVASLRWLGGEIPAHGLSGLFPELDDDPSPVPAVVLHNAPGRFRPITTAIAALIDGAQETLDVVNPYVTDRAMIKRIVETARRGRRVRLFVPANPKTGRAVQRSSFTTSG